MAFIINTVDLNEDENDTYNEENEKDNAGNDTEKEITHSIVG